MTQSTGPAGSPLVVVVRVAGEASEWATTDGVYRYELWRHGLGGAGTCVFVGVNPSTATALVDDPTIRRMKRFAREWGYASLGVVNLFALRATQPKRLWEAADPVGPDNDRHLRDVFAHADVVVAAWGVAAPAWRIEEVVSLRREWRCLGLTKAGAPRHPLYVRANAPLIDVEFES